MSGRPWTDGKRDYLLAPKKFRAPVRQDDPGRGALWTDEEVQWLGEHYGQFSAKECADTLNRSVGSVRLKIHHLRNPRQPRPPTADAIRFIYVIGSHFEHGPVKIGYSKDPSKRLIELRVGSPVSLMILSQCPLFERDDLRSVERQVHDWFKHWRLEGEWFDLPPAVARSSILKFCRTRIRAADGVPRGTAEAA